MQQELVGLHRLVQQVFQQQSCLMEPLLYMESIKYVCQKTRNTILTKNENCIEKIFSNFTDSTSIITAKDFSVCSSRAVVVILYLQEIDTRGCLRLYNKINKLF